MKALVVTADDFGLATEVNEAVEIAHRDGILSAASLMVGSPAAADAVARARRLPNLRVGLHLTLVEATPMLPPYDIPDLVSGDGRLRSDMAAMSFGLLRSASMRRQLAAEIEAQFSAFAATGLRFDHVNAHKHFHINPFVAGHVLRIGRRYGMRALRVPREPTATLRAVEPVRRGRGVAESALARRLAQQAGREGLAFTDHVFGLAWTGAVTRERLAALLTRLPEGSSEIYLHPATADRFDGCAVGYQYRGEFAALTAPDVIAAARASGGRVCGYADL